MSSALVTDLLDLLKIHEWKSETIAIDEKNRTWACRVKDILSKATGDEIALSDSGPLRPAFEKGGLRDVTSGFQVCPAAAANLSGSLRGLNN